MFVALIPRPLAVSQKPFVLRTTSLRDPLRGLVPRQRLEAAATAVGLVAATMRAQVEASQWKTAVDERVAAAHEIGIHAVPTFLFDERLAVQGAQPLDVFERVMQRLGATPRAGSS